MHVASGEGSWLVEQRSSPVGMVVMHVGGTEASRDDSHAGGARASRDGGHVGGA